MITRTLLRRFAALSALLVTVGCSETAPDMPTGPATPAMWVIHDADTRIVILGSVHQLPDGLDWTGGRLATELAAADELILELAPEETARAPVLFAQTASDEQVPSLSERFTENSGREIRAMLGPASERQESWAIALALGNAAAEQQGLSAAHGVEQNLTRRFRARRLPISGFETAEQQLSLFDTLPPPQQDIMVRAALDGRAEAPARTRRLLVAWSAGNTDTLAEIAEQSLAETPGLAEPLVFTRNRAWADALVRRLARPGDVFVAVGVGHLVGRRSLFDVLRERGVRAMRLQ
jgi:uncharacterized protein